MHVTVISMWTLPTHDTYPQAMFGAVRKHDIHTGVDIYLPEGTQVTALLPGKVIEVEWFTGTMSDPPTPWWHDTQAVWVELGDGRVVVYGEVIASVTKCQSVEGGDIIGTVKQVLKVDKGTPTSMLHLELYSQRPLATAVWGIGEPQPDYLMDPTVLITCSI